MGRFSWHGKKAVQYPGGPAKATQGPTLLPCLKRPTCWCQRQEGRVALLRFCWHQLCQRSSAPHGLRMVWGFGPGLRQEPPGATESADSCGQEKEGGEGKGLWVPFPTIKKTNCLSSSRAPELLTSHFPCFPPHWDNSTVQGFALLASLQGRRRRRRRVQQFSRPLAHL